MKAIIYISQSIYDFSPDELLSLSNKAAKHNANAGITGYLWHEKGQFLQYIEGDEDALDSLILKIDNDQRHNILHQIHTNNITEPKFPHWSMKYFHPNQMIEINHEKILSDQLLFLKSTAINDSTLTTSVWRLADSLARYNQ